MMISIGKAEGNYYGTDMSVKLLGDSIAAACECHC
jgi:hypothetical protein